MNNNMESDVCERRQSTYHECAFAWMCVAIGYLFCRSFLTSYYPVGMFLIITAAIAAAVFVLVKNGNKLDGKSIVFAVISVAFAAAPIFTTDFAVTFFSLVISVVAYCYLIYASNSNCLESGWSNFIVVDFYNAVVIFPFRSFGKLFPALFSGKKRSLIFVFKLILGLLIGLIPALTVTFLLAYDTNFSRIMQVCFDAFDDFDLFSHIGSLMLGTVIAILLFGLYYSSVEHYDGKIKIEDCRKTLRMLRFIPCLTICAALIPLVAVYIVFFISQFDYYISAFSGVLPEGLSYASYAREGFFQLCQVSGINLCLIIAVSLFTKDGNHSKLFLKVVKILLSIIALALISTAMSKVVLYIDAYGLTVKRVLSSWLMIVLALVFLLVIIKQFMPKLKIVASSLCVAVVMFALLAFSNYPSIIANYNVDKYISGELETVDIGTLVALDEPAMPAMIRLAEHYESQLRDAELSSVERFKINEQYKHLSAYIGVNEKEGIDKIFGFSVPYINALNEVKEYRK